jgi:multicomponent Na+:H+ antiporter subunit G
MILETIGYALIIIGAIFLFLGALGIYRMPDVYSRMQAGTKATTLGAMGVVFGVGLVQPEWFWKTFIIVMFIALSNPISSHALARGSYKLGIKPFTKKEGLDDLDGVYEAEDEK